MAIIAVIIVLLVVFMLTSDLGDFFGHVTELD